MRNISSIHCKNQQPLPRYRRGGGEISAGFDYNELERFLLFTVEQYCYDRALALSAKAKSRLLSRHCLRQKSKEGVATASSHDDRQNMEDVAVILSAFMDSSSPNLPTSVVYQVHSFMGLISLARQDNEAALSSFTKALWIVVNATNNEIPQEQQAVTVQRMGMVYGASGQYREASNLLRKAMAIYEKTNIGTDHDCIRDARKAMIEFDLLQKSSKSLMPEKSFRKLRGVTSLRKTLPAGRIIRSSACNCFTSRTKFRSQRA
jgi:tetratricopeptide (TPR) repeat protein